MTDTEQGNNKRRRVANNQHQPHTTAPVDLTRPSSDGRYWLSKIREHHPTIERVAKNRFRPDPDEPELDGYLFCDEDEEGVTELERDEMLSSTWKDQFVRREALVRRLLQMPGSNGMSDDFFRGDPSQPVAAAPGCPPWPPSHYDPMPLSSYELVINFCKRRPMWIGGGGPTITEERDNVTTIVASMADMVPSPGCDTFWDSPCSRHRGGNDFCSSVMIDLTPWRDELPKLFTSGRWDDKEDRPDMEIIVIKKGDEDDGGGTSDDEGRGNKRSGVEVATLFGRGHMGNGFGCSKVEGEECSTKPYRAQCEFDAYSGPGHFGDEYFVDIFGNAGGGNPNRPWLPQVAPYLHERGARGEAGSRWELHLGIRWGGKVLNERFEPMGERDVRAFLEHGLEWNTVGRESDEVAYLYDAARGGRRCWTRTLPPSPGSEERSGFGAGLDPFGTDSHDLLHVILSKFTFLLDLYEMRGEEDGTPSSSAADSPSRPSSIISVDVPTAGRVRDGRLALDVTDVCSRDAVRDWLLGRRNGAEIGGMVTVIERGTGKQAQLFVGRVITNTSKAKPSVGGGYKYFPSFAALQYFSKDEAYSRVIWPETVLRLAAGGSGRDGRVSFNVGFHWFDSRKKSYHAMEDHLVKLFLMHALVYN